MSTQTEAPGNQQAPDAAQSLELSSISPGLTVADIQASLHWYCEIVGFTLAQEYEHEGELRGASLVAGSAHLMISQDDWAKGRDRVKGVGHRLHLSTPQDVDEIARSIKERGGSLASEPQDMPWGARAFNLVDPDGFQLTVSSEM